MYISGKDKLGYINGDYPYPPETNPSFRKWRTENAMVKGWLINSMDHSLVVNFIRYPTTKQVWDAAATTYFDGIDTSQVYELRRRVSRMKQAGGSIEKYYNNLQGGASYPDWWQELQARKKRDAPATEDVLGRAAMATAESPLSLIPVTEPFASTPDQGNCGQVFSNSTTRNDGAWIIDSEATDHMTFDPNDFSNTTQPRRTCIANANGATYPVTGAGTVPLSPSLSLAHTLLVPSLSNKLMSVSQITEELNCVVLIYSTFCLLQDVLSKEIIGCGAWGTHHSAISGTYSHRYFPMCRMWTLPVILVSRLKAIEFLILLA
ncbi:hypothetical protein MRB53_027744 [Persea americana]|uniref:Uncharacterized protein n=1 Tax=Persea americana TaxID=3435 RepID=A0ACC2LML7_PERAE|nr:hypothetical protein MRB53_027744 [Persea americana]